MERRLRSREHSWTMWHPNPLSPTRSLRRYKAFMQAALEQSHGLLPTPEAIMARRELLQATSTSLAHQRAEALQALDGVRLERAAAAADGRERCERLHLQLLVVQLACDRAERAAHGLLARTGGLAAQERCGAADGEAGSAAFDGKVGGTRKVYFDWDACCQGQTYIQTLTGHRQGPLRIQSVQKESPVAYTNTRRHA